MRIELRRRMEPKQKCPECGDEYCEKHPLQLSHIYLLIIFEGNESKIIDQFGRPGTKFVGEVRLSDGYGEHYLLIQPTHIELGNGNSREVNQDESVN